MSAKSQAKNEETIAELSVYDIVALLASTASEAEKCGFPVQIRQHAGRIGIMISGFEMGEGGEIVATAVGGNA